MLSHRLRDTFAVDLLEKGVPLEEVSKLLGHESIRLPSGTIQNGSRDGRTGWTRS
jgi:site-specific recombinase XerD